MGRLTISRSRSQRHIRALAAGFAVLVLGGCASGGLETSALQPSGAGVFSSLPSLPKIELPSAPPPIVGTSTELYERIGRGLRRCWLGLDSPMRQTHLYEAIAEPAHKGGRAEIIIREKDAVEGAAAGSGQRGGRALRIAIQPDVSSADRATVEIENLKLPEADAARLKRDVNAWAIGGLGCEAAAEADAWTPSAPPAADANHKPPKKSKAARKPDRPAKTGG